MLGAPVTTAEVQEAIKLLQSGKSPGPDCLTAKYYKTFSTLLSPYLADMYNEAFALPDILLEATISLLLKKDKDPLLFSSYRPISLLNLTSKVFPRFSPYGFRLFCHLS